MLGCEFLRLIGDANLEWGFVGSTGAKGRYGQDLCYEDAEEGRNVKERPGAYVNALYMIRSLTCVLTLARSRSRRARCPR